MIFQHVPSVVFLLLGPFFLHAKSKFTHSRVPYQVFAAYYSYSTCTQQKQMVLLQLMWYNSGVDVSIMVMSLEILIARDKALQSVVLQ
jgi:hypothetical protein